MRCLQSCGHLLKFCIQKWLTYLTLDPALVLDIPKVLCKWLLLFYITEGPSIFRALTIQSSGVKVFRQFGVEERALVLEFAGQDLTSRNARQGEGCTVEVGQAQLP